MGFRKVIGFGDSSFVISLPKEWVDKHRIKKGDVVNVSEESNELKITPHGAPMKKENKEITITFDNNLKDLKAQLFRSYIDDYNIINVQKKGIYTYAKDVRRLVNDNFIALDVIQSGDDKITMKDFLNLSEVSVYDLIRRMDRILMSMFEDVREVLSGDESKKQLVTERDDEINKLYNLLLRVLKKAFNPNERTMLNLEISEVFYYWEFMTSIEEIGDQLKRMIRITESKVDKQTIDLFNNVYENYKKAVKSNFTKDVELATDTMNLRKSFSDKCEEEATKLNFNSILIIEKIKMVNKCSGDIARSYIKLGIKN